MPQSEIPPPPRQRTFEFARTDVWRQLPEAARNECLRLIARQLTMSLEFEHKQEERDEREDPC